MEAKANTFVNLYLFFCFHAFVNDILTRNTKLSRFCYQAIRVSSETDGLVIVDI